MVTFFTGVVLTEAIVTLDDEERRLVWSIVDGPYEHHNASVRVTAEPDGTTLFTWEADILPDEAAERTDAMMERGTQVAKETLEAALG